MFQDLAPEIASISRAIKQSEQKSSLLEFKLKLSKIKTEIEKSKMERIQG